MMTKSQKLQNASELDLKRQFRIAKGLDGSPLKAYYQPNQPRVNLHHFNSIELSRLKGTCRRGKFEWSHLVLASIGGFIAPPPSRTRNLLWPWFVNLVCFWIVLVAEITNSSVRSSAFYLFFIAILIWFLVTNQRHLLWKTRDKIEIAKLTERSLYLEERVGVALINYIKTNLLMMFLLRWATDAGALHFTGGQISSPWSWIASAFDNMILLLALLDFGSIFGFTGISNLRSGDAWSTLFMLLIVLFNHIIGLESLKEILQIVEKNGRLPSVITTLTRVLQRFL